MCIYHCHYTLLYHYRHSYSTTTTTIATLPLPCKLLSYCHHVNCRELWLLHCQTSAVLYPAGYTVQRPLKLTLVPVQSSRKRPKVPDRSLKKRPLVPVRSLRQQLASSNSGATSRLCPRYEMMQYRFWSISTVWPILLANSGLQCANRTVSLSARASQEHLVLLQIPQHIGKSG